MKSYLEMTEADMKAWIDSASYEELLRRWRYEEDGSPFCYGEMGEHFMATMAKKKDEVGEAEHVRASKRIERMGWLWYPLGEGVGEKGKNESEI